MAVPPADGSPSQVLERMRQIFDAMPDGVVVIDRKWVFTFANRRALEIVSKDSIVGHDIFELFPGNLQEPFYSTYKNAMDARLEGSFEAFHTEPLNLWFKVEARPHEGDGIIVFFSDITERKAYDQIVKTQQELLTVVQRAARVVTWELDPVTGKIIYGAGSFQLSGHPREQLDTLDKILVIVPPEHRTTVQQKVAESLATGETALTEFPVEAADGSLVWLESRGQALRLGEQSLRIRGMSIDVTQRKLDQLELVASEERYRVLADLNPQAIWMGDPQGVVTYANQGFLSYLGLTADDLRRNGFLDAVAPVDRERLQREWMDCAQTAKDFDSEAMMCNAATNEYRYWHLRAAPVRTPTGQVLHWLGVANDIHEAKTYAASLRAEQVETERRRAELETLYRTTPIGLALFDPVDFRFLNCNDHEAEMLGHPKSELIGRRLEDIVPPDKVPGLLELFRSVAAGNAVKDRLLEGELLARPGEKRAFSVNYSPVFNQDGSVRAISSASIEITNQKRSEAALIQSEKLAAVGRLASSISHEINNPLEAITNLLYLVSMDEELPEALKMYVHLAQSELQRVSQIATQTLRFHRQAVNATQVTAEELVGAVLRLYTGRLANSNIKVDARYSTQAKLLCFENDIRQVLNNLIANAIDAMRSGGSLIVRAHDTAGKTGVRITIADTGHGMSQSTLHRIFEPFFTTKDLQGTGLGLWISHGIVARHQGKLSVRSSEDPVRHGTIFTLFLPCKET